MMLTDFQMRPRLFFCCCCIGFFCRGLKTTAQVLKLREAQRVSMKAPHMMTKLLPLIFLFHFAPWLRVFFRKNVRPFFPCRVTFGPPKIPLWWKLWKIVQKQFLIAQKKRLDALNATQKTTAPNKVRFLKKSWKTSKKYHFWPKRKKMIIFYCYFLFFSETVFC